MQDGRRIADAERVSTFGTFLRSFRCDELPQLLNVVRGDMSFIGPRPLLLSEQESTPAARLLVRPGLTGWAQVCGGRELSGADKLVLDLWYIKHASFRMDVEIAIKTIAVILRGERLDTKAVQMARNEFASIWLNATSPVLAAAKVLTEKADTDGIKRFDELGVPELMGYLH